MGTYKNRRNGQLFILALAVTRPTQNLHLHCFYYFT